MKNSVFMSSKFSSLFKISALNLPDLLHLNRCALPLLILTVLISGCATETPKLSTPGPVKAVKSHGNKAAYNRPYTVKGKTYYPLTSADGYREKGLASWYGAESGNHTAMGTRFRPHGLSAAHKTLPLPSKVRVTNLENGRAVDLWVNDRGPFKKNRIIDLSHGAAKAIGVRGVAKVQVEYLASQARNDD